MSTKFNERLFAMQRPNTFTYKTRKIINKKGSIDLPRPLKIANPLLEIRRAQSFVMPGPLARRIPTLDDIRTEEIRKFGMKVNISSEGLAEAISNKFLQVDKLDRNGNIIRDPITNKPLKENKSLLNLFQTLSGTNLAMKVLLKQIDSDIKTTGIANQQQIVLLQTAIYNAVSYAPQIKNINANVNPNNIATVFRIMDQIKLSDTGDFVFGTNIIRPVTVTSMKIGDFLKIPEKMIYFFQVLPENVTSDMYADLIWELASEKNQNKIIDFNIITSTDFWRDRKPFIKEEKEPEEEKVPIVEPEELKEAPTVELKDLDLYNPSVDPENRRLINKGYVRTVANRSKKTQFIKDIIKLGRAKENVNRNTFVGTHFHLGGTKMFKNTEDLWEKLLNGTLEISIKNNKSVNVIIKVNI